MERLILLCLLSPAIFAQPRKNKDPNDEPFLPIFPVYPYNPKLIKRGADRELTTQLMPELYAPKVDAKDSYNSNYNTNYPKDSHYNSDLKNNSPASAYPSYYNGDAYAYVHSPYAVYNSYPTPYAVNPASYPVYPNYYYQQPYYYPHYYNHASFPPPPPPPPQPGVGYQETSQDSAEDDKRGKQSKKPKDDETSQDVPSTSQYVDGGNYISSGGGSRDLDVQSSTYKLASPYNQLESNAQVRNLPIPLPKTTYRLINVAGQSVNPNYPLPTTYIKIQQMEQQVNQALAKLLAQQQAGQSYGNHKITLNDANGGLYAGQNVYNLNAAPYVTLPTVKIKPAFVINADGTTKVNGGQANSQDSSPQRNKSTKSSVLYVRKPATLENSQTANPKHRASDSRLADQTDEYDGYDASQSYADDKQKSNYYQSGSYQSKDLTVTPQTPQYSYQYSAYAPDETQQPQSQGDKITTADNFGAKQYKKG